MTFRTMFVCASLAATLLASRATAALIPLEIADFESNPNNTGQFGSIAPWGPNGSWAFHAGFARPGNETLGERFGYYSAGTTETVGLLTPEAIEAGATYTFWSFANDGGTPGGAVPYQIGYAATPGDRASFVALATNVVDVSASPNGAWFETPGVTFTAGAAGPEVGKELIVRLGSAADGGLTDIWFDNMRLDKTTAIPEPGSLVLLASGLAGLAGLRRRRA